MSENKSSAGGQEAKGNQKPKFIGIKFRGNYRNQKFNGKKNYSQGKGKRTGECAELGEHIYFIGEARQADNYTKTTEAILNYIQRTYYGGNEVRKALEDGEPYGFEAEKPAAKPSTITSTGTVGDVDQMILGAEIKQFVDRKVKYADNMHMH